MKTFNIVLLLAIFAINLKAADWGQTSGPKKNGDYQQVNTIKKVSNYTFVVGTELGDIYKTTNSGSTWNLVKSLPSSIWTINRASNGYLFIGSSQNGIYRSTDNGNNWTQVLNVGSLVFEIGFGDNSDIYACVELEGLYKSTNNGSTWSLLYPTDLVPSSVFVEGNNIYLGTMLDGMYFSDDGGQNFSPMAFSGDIVWSIQKHQGAYYVGTEGEGLNYSDDGSNFVNIAFPNSNVSSMFVSSSGREYVIQDNNVYRYNPNTNTWDSFNDGMSYYGVSEIDEDKDGYMLAATLGEGVFKTTTSTLDPEILTLSAVSSEYCAGQFFTLDYTARGGFESNNSFHIQLSDSDGAFDNPIDIGFTESQVSGSIDVIIPFDMPQGANHQLRIVSTHPSIIGPNSQQFVINALSTNLTNPTYGATNVDLRPTFNWDANDCSLGYSLQISKHEDFSTLDYQYYNLSENHFTMTGDTLDTLTTYYWRVVLYSTLGDELYSETSSFTTYKTPPTVTQEIHLTAGWNLVSTYITNDSMNVVDYLSSISDKMVIAKNQTGSSYIPQYNINNIGDWSNEQAYLIYVNANDTLKVTGKAIEPENYDINIKVGWNKVSYIRNTELSVVTAFQELTDNNMLLIAKNQTGSVYIPSFNINSIGNLIPGNGYNIYVTSAGTFKYPAN